MAQRQTEPRITGPRSLIIGTLERVGGRLESEDGLATKELYGLLLEQGAATTEKALANSLKKMEDGGLIVREVRGKRTYAIGVPEAVTEAARQGADAALASAKEMQAKVRDKVGSARVGETADEWRDMADALLIRVGEILAAADGGRDLRGLESELVDARGRLAEALDERQRQVGKVVQLGDELVATKAERDGLRARLRAAEENIDRMLKGDGYAGGDRAFKALERFMQEKPMARR